MTEEKKQFVLYEYLLYFWRKKWFFLIVPIITTVLIASAIYMLKSDHKYTGQLIVSTGSINSPNLTNPNNILAIFHDDINANLDIFVSEKGQVKFTIKGDSKEDVDQKLSHIAEVYNEALLNNYNLRYDVSTESLNRYRERSEILKDALEMYKGKLDKMQEDLQADQLDEMSAIDQFDDITLLTIETEEELSDVLLKISKIEGDLVFFLKPEVLFQTVHPTKTYLKESIAIGLILGVLLTVALLMLLKYLGVARRNYSHD